MKDRTKLMFAEALEKMLETIPLDKVRVSRLCAACGATTPTFYYYFHDKYELVAWIFLRDFMAESGGQQKEYSPAVIEAMNARLAKRRNFYQKAFLDNSQNSIYNYVLKFNMQIAGNAYEYAFGQPMNDEQRRLLKYHFYGVMGLFREWLYGKGQDMALLSALFYEKTPDFMKEAFSRYPYPAKEILQNVGKA